MHSLYWILQVLRYINTIYITERETWSFILICSCFRNFITAMHVIKTENHIAQKISIYLKGINIYIEYWSSLEKFMLSLLRTLTEALAFVYIIDFWLLMIRLTIKKFDTWVFRLTNENSGLAATERNTINIQSIYIFCITS